MKTPAAGEVNGGRARLQLVCVKVVRGTVDAMARRDDETTVVRGPPPPDGPPPDGPPPWWRENWWLPLLALLLIVGLLIAFFAWRESDDGDGDRVVAPDVVGLQEAQARERVTAAGLEPSVERVASEDPEGEVIAQEPGAGTQLEEGEEVLLSVSAGGGETTTVTETETTTETETETETETTTETVEEEPQTASVPDVVGAQHADAGVSVEETGLVPDSYPVDSQEDRGTVVAQNPDPGTELAAGEHVRLNVALGPDDPPSAEVPDVTGAGEREARDRLRVAGFTVRTLDRDAPEQDNVGEVILQRPGPGSHPALTQVTIYVGR
jgi:eukaryotic-like serine/threonine-protein kinase